MNAEQTRRTATAWMERSQHVGWSAEDQAELDVWLADDGNRVAYLRIKAIWQRTDHLTALRQPAQQPMRAERNPARNNFWPFLRRATAGLVLAAALGAVAWQQMHTPVEETYVTAIGEHKAITFRDGTRVELNTDTVLRVSRNSTERKAWLDKGEAYFEVEHDAARPLIVIANGRKITDLGTKFAVRQDAENLRVTVVEGLVEVAAKDQQPQSLLKPGDVLTATPEAQSVTQKPLRKLRAALDWKNGKLFLEDVTLAEAVAEFNRYNTTKLVIADPKVAKLTITGTFQTRHPDSFTSVTEYIFGLKAKTENDQIILSR